MRATVKVFAKAADVLVLKVEQPQYVDVNQVLHPKERGADMSYKKEGWNWRNLYLPTLKAVSISKPMFHIKDQRNLLDVPIYYFPHLSFYVLY